MRAIAEADGIAPLVELLRGGSAFAKENAAAALGNSAINTARRKAIVDAGAIPALVELLRSGGADVVVATLAALVSDATTAAAFRAQVAEPHRHRLLDGVPRTNAGLIATAGGIELLEQFVRVGTLEYRGMASWVLAKVRAASEGLPSTWMVE